MRMKEGLDYFPLSVTNTDLVDLVEAEFGPVGFAVLIKLFQKIYGGYGYYCKWSEDVEMIFAKRVGVGRERLANIVKGLVKWGIFDRDIYENYSVLTSLEIQERFLEATNRRKRVTFKKEFLLFFPKGENVYILDENVSISGENVYISDENVDISKQSKVKESKKKESRACEFSAHPQKKPYGEYGNVYLTEAEHERLKQRYPRDYFKLIEQLGEYMESTGKEYKSHYATIKRWAEKDVKVRKETEDFSDLEMLTRRRIAMNRGGEL